MSEKEKNGVRNKGKNNKAGYTATEVAFGWAGAIFEVTRRLKKHTDKLAMIS